MIQYFHRLTNDYEGHTFFTFKLIKILSQETYMEKKYECKGLPNATRMQVTSFVLSDSKDGVAKVCKFFLVHLETTNASNSQHGQIPLFAKKKIF